MATAQCQGCAVCRALHPETLTALGYMYKYIRFAQQDNLIEPVRQLPILEHAKGWPASLMLLCMHGGGPLQAYPAYGVR